MIVGMSATLLRFVWKKKSSTARLAVQRLVQLLHLLKPHKNHTVKSLKPKNWQTHSLFYALSIFSNFRLVPYNLARERSRDLELQRAQNFSNHVACNYRQRVLICLYWYLELNIAKKNRYFIWSNVLLWYLLANTSQNTFVNY